MKLETIATTAVATVMMNSLESISAPHQWQTEMHSARERL